MNLDLENISLFGILFLILLQSTLSHADMLPVLQPSGPLSIQIRYFQADFLPTTPDSIYPTDDCCACVLTAGLCSYIEEKLRGYEKRRHRADLFGSENGNSGLSAYLRWGLLSARELYWAVEVCAACCLEARSTRHSTGHSTGHTGLSRFAALQCTQYRAHCAGHTVGCTGVCRSYCMSPLGLIRRNRQ